MAHTNVSLRGPHGCRGNSKNLFDSLTSKAKFSDDLLVGERGKESVGPGVDADLMAGHIFLDQDLGSLNDTGANNKESCRDIFIIEVLEQLPV